MNTTHVIALGKRIFISSSQIGINNYKQVKFTLKIKEHFCPIQNTFNTHIVFYLNHVKPDTINLLPARDQPETLEQDFREIHYVVGVH